MSINNAIAKAIQDNLPAATAGELTTYLEQAKRTAQELDNTKAELLSKESEIKDLTHSLREYESMREKYNILFSKKNDIEDQERNLRVVIAELKVLEAEKRATELKELAALAFRNPRVTQYESGSIPIACPPGSFPQSQHYNKHITTEEN